MSFLPKISLITKVGITNTGYIAIPLICILEDDFVMRNSLDIVDWSIFYFWGHTYGYMDGCLHQTKIMIKDIETAVDNKLWFSKEDLPIICISVYI